MVRRSMRSSDGVKRQHRLISPSLVRYLVKDQHRAAKWGRGVNTFRIPKLCPRDMLHRRKPPQEKSETIDWQKEANTGLTLLPSNGQRGSPGGGHRSVQRAAETFPSLRNSREKVSVRLYQKAPPTMSVSLTQDSVTLNASIYWRFKNRNSNNCSALGRV